MTPALAQNYALIGLAIFFALAALSWFAAMIVFAKALQLLWVAMANGVQAISIARDFAAGVQPLREVRETRADAPSALLPQVPQYTDAELEAFNAEAQRDEPEADEREEEPMAYTDDEDEPNPLRRRPRPLDTTTSNAGYPDDHPPIPHPEFEV